MTKNVPRQQHYLPNGYLKGFTDLGHNSDSGKLRVIDLHTRKFFSKKPDGVAKMRDFYVFQNTDGQADYRMETEVFQQIDSDGAQVIREVARTHRLPTGKDWEILAAFVALLQLRTPEFRHANQEMAQHMFDIWAHSLANSPEAYAQMVKEDEAQTGEKWDQTYEEFRDDVLNHRILVEEPRSNDIKHMLEIAPQIATIILNMTPHLIIAVGEARFVTGDVPIHFFDTNKDRRESGLRGVGWSTPGVQVTVPLSSTCCLMLDWGEESMFLPGFDIMVAQVNTHRAADCRRYLFYPPGAKIPLLHPGKLMTWGEEAVVESFADGKTTQPAIEIMGGGVPRRPPENVR